MSKPLLKILNKQPTDRLPIWFMRQAGRYLPEYREVRKKFPNFLEFCQNPDAATEVTIQPLRRFDLDAAILFSDILVVPYALGMDVQFKKNEGPVLDNIKSPSDIKKLKEPNIKIFENIAKSVSQIKSELDRDFKQTALIGFAGSPWTVAAYMFEGKGSKDFNEAKKFAYLYEEEFSHVIDLVTDATIKYLELQIMAGAEVIKLFDSWSGMLAEKEFKKWVGNPTKKIVRSINQKFPNIPIIGFPRKAGVMYKYYAEFTGVNAVAFDQYTPISWGYENLKDKVIQGNIDNVLMMADKSRVEREVQEFLKEIDYKRTIVNLGHGLLPESKIENVQTVIETIRKNGS